jgi:hypothetical protein
MRALLRRVLLGLMVPLALLTTVATAHEMSMAEMELRETSPGEFRWQWTATNDRAVGEGLKPVWPEGCRGELNLVHCGAGGLQGLLEVEGVGQRYSAALVKVHWADGQTRVYTLTAGQPTVRLFGSADDRRSLGDIASAYLVLGIEHILGGLDHLLFVTGLLFLVGFRRRLAWAITAFTAAHTLTVASAALGWLSLRTAPVEACIALSIVFVASEALRDRQTLARRWPALVAFIFGLVHGLGFAGALQSFGLPQQHIAAALLTFNLGVELGQLLVLGLTWGLFRLVQNEPWVARLRTPALYGIGSLAACWSFLRVAAIIA